METKTFIKFCMLVIFLFVIISTSLNAFATTNNVTLKMKIKNSTNIAWTNWDNCDTRQYGYEYWGTDPGNVSLTWGYFQGRDCLKVTIITNQGFLRTDQAFFDENWNSPITGVRVDVFSGTNTTGNTVKFEALNHNLATIQSGNYTSSNLVYNQWKELGWNFSGDYSQVAKFFIVFESLGKTYKPHTFYVDNICIVSNGKPIPWDIMNQPHNWRYSVDGDAVNWNTTSGASPLIPITHNNTSASNPVGALFMQWNQSVGSDPWAKLEAKDFTEDWSLYEDGKIRADIYCTGTNHIYISFWDGTNGAATAEKRVTSLNTWETITWDMPSASYMNWNNITSISFFIVTSPGAGDSTGTIYIDNIKRGR